MYPPRASSLANRSTVPRTETILARCYFQRISHMSVATISYKLQVYSRTSPDWTTMQPYLTVAFYITSIPPLYSISIKYTCNYYSLFDTAMQTVCPPSLDIVACQRDGVSNEPLGQRQDTGPGILWSIHRWTRPTTSMKTILYAQQTWLSACCKRSNTVRRVIAKKKKFVRENPHHTLRWLLVDPLRTLVSFSHQIYPVFNLWICTLCKWERRYS